MTDNTEEEELFEEYKKKEEMIVDDKEINVQKIMSMKEGSRDMPDLEENLEKILEKFDDEDTEKLTDMIKFIKEMQGLTGGSASGSSTSESSESSVSEREIEQLRELFNDKIERLEQKYDKNVEEEVEEIKESLASGAVGGRGGGGRMPAKTVEGPIKIETESVTAENTGASFDETEEEEELVTETEEEPSEEDTPSSSDTSEMVQSIDEGESQQTTTSSSIDLGLDDYDVDTIDTEEKAEKKKQKNNLPAYLTVPDSMKVSPYDKYEEVERYWLEKPYCYASILYNEEQGDYRYYVVEPSLSDKENFVLDRLNDVLKDQLLHEDITETQSKQKSEKVLREKSQDIMKNIDVDLSENRFEKVFYYIKRDHLGYEELDPIMHDDYVEDISCDGTNVPVFVYHKEYRNLMTNVIHENEADLKSLITKLAQMSGQSISTAEPIKSITLPDGSRGEVTLGESSDKGPTYTIRKFQEIPFTPIDLIRTGTFNTTQMAYLWLAIVEETSLLFAGGTGSGKTTSMNAISMFIPPKEKIVTIEDTREITLPHRNWVPLVTREKLDAGEGDNTGIDEYELLRSALRQNPEYLIVGEIRGEEAKTLFQAMSTGHTTYSTMHAESPNEAIRRLENDPINVPRQMINALDIISIQKLQKEREKGEGLKKVRRNQVIMEIKDVPEEGTPDGIAVFELDASSDKFIENLQDSIVLRNIMQRKGWTFSDVEEDLKKRKKVLQYLIDKDIRDVEIVAQVIRTYMSEPEIILNKIKNETLEDTDFRDITKVSEVDFDKSLDQLQELEEGDT